MGIKVSVILRTGTCIEVTSHIHVSFVTTPPRFVGPKWSLHGEYFQLYNNRNDTCVTIK